jgi:drug/metabolite transporter superfamily protein YnfA
MLYVFSTCLWIGVTVNSRLFSRSMPASYRYQLICLSFLFVIFSVTGLELFWWAVFHPSQFYQNFYIQSGFFPPLANLLITFLAAGIGHIELCIGYWLAQQKSKSCVWACRASPIILVIYLLGFALESQRDKTIDDPYFIYGSALVLVSLIYFWLFSFCKNPKNRELMMRTQQSASNGSGRSPSP